MHFRENAYAIFQEQASPLFNLKSSIKTDRYLLAKKLVIFPG